MNARASVVIVLITALVVCLSGHWLEQTGWWFNVSASAPSGLWHIKPLIAHLNRHTWVIACPASCTYVFTTAKARGYLPPGPCPGNFAPLIKQVAAVPGDTVQLTRHGIHVNGHLLPHTRPLVTDRHGRSMPQLNVATHRVPPGLVWLISGQERARGFDSRYFGPLPIRQVLGQAKLVWGWGNPQVDALAATPGR